MRTFLDVGAHAGETLIAAQRWRFDRIFCFEPSAQNFDVLTELADDRTVLCKFGLWNATARVPLYHADTIGASLWKRPNRPQKGVNCDVVRASEWVRANIAPDDTVWMKINVEGAELDILEDLIGSGEFDKINFCVVMWDSHKIPALKERGADVQARIMKQFAAPKLVSSKQVPPGRTHAARIDNWLDMTAAAEKFR